MACGGFFTLSFNRPTNNVFSSTPFCKCVNGPCFASRPTIEELSDPSYNVEFGTRMLERLVNKVGSLREALKAYGPMDMNYSYADRVLAIYENYR